MLILNFSHPLTESQLAKIESIAGEKVSGVIEISSQIDHSQSLEKQIHSMIESACLTPQEWQTKLLLLNLPSLNYSAAAILAQLHGRIGHFPPVLYMRPIAKGITPHFEVANILNLQAMREQAREKR